MAKQKDLTFKPYVGLFFKFTDRIHKNPKSVIMGPVLYGNQIQFRTRKKFSDPDNIPKSILVVDEKRNHVRFLSHDNNYYWTSKAQIEPIDLPTFDGNPIPHLVKFREYLVYCTDTKIRNFSIEKMTQDAIKLLPQVDAMIENYRAKILPK